MSAAIPPTRPERRKFFATLRLARKKPGRSHRLEPTISQKEFHAFDQSQYPPDVQLVRVRQREFILVGTAHVSQESVNLVRRVITQEHPDNVCVELDARRYTALSDQRSWEDLDLKQIIQQRQLSPLLVNLILASYQKKLGGQLGVLPGTELLEATKIARECGIPIALCDRDVRVTLGRAWHATPWFKKVALISSLLVGALDTSHISEETLRDIRQQDALSELLQELGKVLPTLRTVLIDERDAYMAQKIQAASGERIVAVVGAAHLRGICQALQDERQADLQALETIPPTSAVWHWLRWAIPALIVASLLFIAWQKGAAVAGHNAQYWILANGIPSALGAMLALAHPLTILAAFIAAPITSLTPVIGAGYVTALVQAYLRPPIVRELRSVAEDIRSPKQWWRNKLLRIFLAFLLPGIGSMIGTWLGGYEIISNLF